MRALLDEFEALGGEENRAGMARYGINVERAAGVAADALRELTSEKTLRRTGARG